MMALTTWATISRSTTGGQMTTANHEALVRSVYTAYNDRDFDRAAAAVADNYEWTMVPTQQVFNGPDGMRQYLAAWADGFPSSKVEVTNVIVAGDRAVVEFTGRGVHSGTLRTPAGDIPATGRSAELQFCDIYEIAGGKLRRGRSYFDMASLMRQLGLAS
jgi:steroid delta-isomerase-like uncharacterized protein